MDTMLSRRDMLQRAKGLALASPFLSLTACDTETSGRGMVTLSGPTMGTGYSVKIADPPPNISRPTLQAAFEQILETVNRQMSNWRAESEISRFNASPSPSWTGVSSDTLTVVDEALRIGRLSGGAFDPTIGPVVDLWGFGPGSVGGRVPSPERVRAAQKRVGFHHIRTRSTPPALAKGRAGIELDLSGIAKGFGVDKLVAHLERRGIDNYFIEIGGELRARGVRSRRRPWRIGIEVPVTGRREVERIVTLDGAAIATSGNYRTFFERDGTRFSHIIDPRTGAPVNHDLASVTVIAPTCMQADALSTALMVLGPNQGLELARREGLAALFMVNDGEELQVLATDAFDSYRLG